MGAFYGLVMRKYGSQSALCDRAAQLAPLTLSDPSSPQRVGNITNHQQLSHLCKLNLVMSTQRAWSLDHTGGLR